jgi:DNA-directed RNA polymerase beta' subunit
VKLDLFDINDFIKVNSCLPVTSRFYLDSNGGPSDDGLFSTKIFGKFGSIERKNNFGYVDLRRKFFHPLVYMTIYGMFRALPQVVAGEKFCRLDASGKIIVSDKPEDGETGIDFFVKNWNRIRWTKIGEENASRTKKENLLSMLKPEEIFIDKWLIIPAYYRDINFSTASGSKKISVEGVNASYIKLINAATSESITFTNAYLTQSSVQKTLVDIYAELTKKISGKRGVIRQAVMGKSIDFSTIGVLSCPRLTAMDPTKQQVRFNEYGVPLHFALSLFYPFVIKWLEDFFHGYEHAASIVIDGDKRYDLPQTTYGAITSTSLQKLVDSYIKDKTRLIRSQHFWLDGLGDKSKLIAKFEHMKFPDRPFTLTDLFYEACMDVVQTKHVIATRYPVTGPESVIACRVKLLTTEETVDVSGPGEEGGMNDKRFTEYPYFPTDGKGNILHDKIKWIDTYVPNVSFLKGLGGDFDGDTMRVIGLFSAEANLEAERMMASPLNYVDAKGNFIRGIHREGGLAIYMLTK